jgi:hypothetical protein
VHDGLYIRDHIWIAQKHLRETKEGDLIRFKGRIKKYFHNGKVKVAIVKIKDVTVLKRVENENV